jgi:hypothetical protein
MHNTAANCMQMCAMVSTYPSPLYICEPLPVTARLANVLLLLAS